MPLESISLRHLQYFLDVADKGSFARVSSLLDIDQPTLSRSIKRIESELGTMLFRRNGRGVTLTPHGAQLLEHVRTFFGRIEEIQERVSADQLMPRGKVTFALVHHLSESFAPDLLLRFREQYPEVQVHLIGGHSGTIQDLLVDGVIDIGILYDSGNLPDLIVDRIKEDRLHVFGSAAAARSHGLGASVTVKQLCRLPLAMPGKHHGLRRCIDNSLNGTGMRLKVEYEIDILHTLRSLTLRQNLFTVLPLDAVCEVPKDQPYFVAPLVEPEINSVLGLALARNQPLGLATRTFAGFIRSEMKKHIQRQEVMTARALAACALP